MTELQNRFVRECPLSESVFQLVHTEELMSFYRDVEGAGQGKEALLFLPCVLSDDTQACLTRKCLTAAPVNRKPGGFTGPQVCRWCSWSCSSRSLFSTSTSPSCPDAVLTERIQKKAVSKQHCDACWVKLDCSTHILSFSLCSISYKMHKWTKNV